MASLGSIPHRIVLILALSHQPASSARLQFAHMHPHAALHPLLLLLSIIPLSAGDDEYCGDWVCDNQQWKACCEYSSKFLSN